MNFNKRTDFARTLTGARTYFAVIVTIMIFVTEEQFKDLTKLSIYFFR